jgi:hypothetical protein
MMADGMSDESANEVSVNVNVNVNVNDWMNDDEMSGDCCISFDDDSMLMIMLSIYFHVLSCFHPSLTVLHLHLTH